MPLGWLGWVTGRLSQSERMRASDIAGDGREREMKDRRVLCCFDHEGGWGMPYGEPYDIEAGTRLILDCLARHDARAVFFTVGMVAVDHPELIREIAVRGHQIGLHGWRHEDLAHLPRTQRQRFERGLAESEHAVELATGSRPVGFRAPYLLGPRFFDRFIYELLRHHGYQWASNREVRHVVELARPDRIRTGRLSDLVRDRPSWLDRPLGRGLLVALNAGLCVSNQVAGTPRSAARWLLDGCPPFSQCGLLEIPLYSPLDCDLLGLPRPSEATPLTLLEYAHSALLQTISRGAPVTMLTFHDWIITGANRLELLDRVLSSLGPRSIRPATVEDCWSELSAMARA